MTLETNLYMGDRAKEVLENEAFIAAYDELDKELTERWKTAPIADKEGRERTFQLLTSLRMVKAAMQRTLETGKLAKLELEHKRSAAQRVRDAISAF